MENRKELGLVELIAIALGGMIGGGIFTILGVSVRLIGYLTPVAIIFGGLIAFLAAYSYVKLAQYFKDEGATYSFFKKTFPSSKFSASIIGWLISFGYISTLALYAYTFSSYTLSSSSYSENILFRKAIAILIIFVFAFINVWSVKGMGKVEDIMVYTKLILLGLVSFILIRNGNSDFGHFMTTIMKDAENSSIMNLMIVASLTFVAYEGFQLVINTQNVATNPDKNIPRAIYCAICLVVIIYVVISIGALFAIPTNDLIKNKEYALASGSGKILGSFGSGIVILSAVLATGSAISGTIFGASRQLSIISHDGFFPKIFSIRKNNIPNNAIFLMATVASVLILIGGLELILEFGSITFLLVSLLMAIANFKLRKLTYSNYILNLFAVIGLLVGAILILYYEFVTKWEQMVFIISIYLVITFLALFYAKKSNQA